MTETKQLITLENAVKLGTLSVFFLGVFTYLADIKQDIALIKQSSVYEVDKLQVQITELKDCCNEKQPKQLVFNEPKAILPNGINLENEN